MTDARRGASPKLIGARVTRVEDPRLLAARAQPGVIGVFTAAPVRRGPAGKGGTQS